MYRHAWIRGGAMLAALIVSWLARLVAGGDTFGYTSRKPQLWETEGPVLEDEPGANLYWHDPYLGHWELCRAWSPASNGCPPNWYGRAEMLALYRVATDSFPMAALGPLGPTALSTADFDAEFAAGVRVMVGKSLGDWYRLEASYFGSHRWDDTAAVRNDDPNDLGGVGNLYSPFSQFGDPVGIAGLDYNNLVSLHFESRLNSGELNLRRRILMRPGCYEASLLLGGRYLDIREQFDYQTRSSVPGPLTQVNEVGIETRNEMLGLQIGLLGQFLIQPRCWIDFEMKGGVYQNRASLARSFTALEIDGEPIPIVGGDQRDRTSFVGDLSLQCNYQFARAWTFYAGYNLVLVSGVALGADNFEPDMGLLTLGPTLIDHSGDLLYHGPNLGLVFAW